MKNAIKAEEIVQIIQAGGEETSERAYMWISSFEDRILQKYFAEFAALEKNPLIEIIPVFISSYGGETASMLALRDLFKSSSKPVATIAVGKAMSAGFFLLCAGTPGLRFASENTEVLIHEVQSGTWGATSEMVKDVAAVERSNARIFSLVKADVGETKFKKMMADYVKHGKGDWFITAAQSLDYGIIDQIGIPRVMTVGGTRSVLALNKEKPAPMKIKKTVTKKAKPKAKKK